MAKKVQTPEEVKTSLDKKVAKRKIFFGTFTKALAFFLAAAMVYSLAMLAFTPAPVVSTTTGGSSTTQEKSEEEKEAEKLFEEEPGENENEGEAKVSKADAIKMLNDATAKAAAAGYDWTRECDYTDDGAIDVGGATDTLNKIIQGVDPNSNLGTVVGSFIGVGTQSGKHAKGGDDIKADDGNQVWHYENYMLKAMKLEEGDVTNYKVTGDEILIQVNQTSNPEKDGGNAMHHATNDFITYGEVKQGIADGLGGASKLLKLEKTDVTYSAILIKATIKDGTLENLELSYTFAASLDLKATLVPIHGTGKAQSKAVYSNFVY